MLPAGTADAWTVHDIGRRLDDERVLRVLRNRRRSRRTGLPRSSWKSAPHGASARPIPRRSAFVDDGDERGTLRIGPQNARPARIFVSIVSKYPRPRATNQVHAIGAWRHRVAFRHDDRTPAGEPHRDSRGERRRSHARQRARLLHQLIVKHRRLLAVVAHEARIESHHQQVIHAITRPL